MRTALLCLAAGALASCTDRPADPAPSPVVPAEAPPMTKAPAASGPETITLGAGCFWCIEAVFQQVDGVLSVVSGYSGGHVENPTYEQVCEKNTGHAEVAQIVYDPSKVSLEKILEIFWKTHDPTTPNRQGNDVGPQYRSAIFWHTEAQRETSERIKKALDAAGAFNRPIVTEVTPFKKFWKAEAYHQNYYRNNPNQGYCRAIILPKLEKFRKVFEKELKQ
jgi:peptide-methionine (S)-S-oxide reductase